MKYLQRCKSDFTKVYSHRGSFIFEGYGIESIITYLGNVLDKFYYKDDARICHAKEAIYSTAVIEAAFKSLKNKSVWTEIEPLEI